MHDSQSPFSPGLPGSIDSVRTPSAASHWRTHAAMHSGPWSERRWAGMPRISMTSATASMTARLPSRRATRRARHSRVYASISVSHRTVRPSWVRVLTQS